MNRPTNCKNCGAILHSDICEYCGTDYSEDETEDLYADGKIIMRVKRSKFGMSFEEVAAAIQKGFFTPNEARGIVVLPEGVDICGK